MMKKTLQFALAGALTFAVGALGTVFTASQIPTWYATLEKPFLTPPNWVFAPVWTLIYLCLAIAVVQIWNVETHEHVKHEMRQRWLSLFIAQLGFNILWSLLFFQLHGLLLSWIAIIFLWVFVLILTLDAHKLDRLTFWLMLPYLVWVTYALVLNIGIWWMN